MDKLWLVVSREYLTRVKSKKFILATILTPLAILLFIVIVALIFKYTNDEQYFALKDDSGLITDAIKDSERVKFKLVTADLETLKKTYKKDGYDGVVYIPQFKTLNKELQITFFSHKQLSLTSKEFVERQISRKIRAHKIEISGYDKKILESFKTEVKLIQKDLVTGEGGEIVEKDKANSAAIATSIGMVMGMIIYFVLLIYGSMIMRSVMEEKINRIVEVIISSVKPFQLMLGKIIGVSGVGLTQFLIWIVLIPLLRMVVGLFIPLDMANPPGELAGAANPQGMEKIMAVMQTVGELNWGMILPLFLIYFLGGYFIYASLFAAVGSAIGDDFGESQSLTIPITIPVILAIYIMIAVIDNPNSSLATWAGIFPLFSPIVMPARLPFDPPVWEIIVSVVVLLLSSVFFIWLSGRIYRVGILMYGKKVTLRELAKWMFYKG